MSVGMRSSSVVSVDSALYAIPKMPMRLVTGGASCFSQFRASSRAMYTTETIHAASFVPPPGAKRGVPGRHAAFPTFGRDPSRYPQHSRIRKLDAGRIFDQIKEQSTTEARAKRRGELERPPIIRDAILDEAALEVHPICRPLAHVRDAGRIRR